MKKHYDERAKNVFSNKEILSFLVAYTIPEFKGMAPKEVMEYFIDNPEIGIHISADIENRIENGATEDSSFQEKLVRYDVRFQMKNPIPESTKYITATLFFDLEIQNVDNPGYSLVRRGIYYLARLLSSQLKTVSEDADYNSLQKVYCIWIVRNTAEKKAGTVQYYHFTNKKQESKPEWDLMELIYIYLGKKEIVQEEEYKDTLKLLYAFFSEDAVERLQDNFDFSQTVIKEVSTMCNLSEGIWQEGLQEGKIEGRVEGRIEGAIRIMLDFGCNKEQIISKLQKEFEVSYEDAKAAFKKYSLQEEIEL